MDSVGRFLVTDGKEIIIEKRKNAKASDVILFLLGSVMGAAILQRGLIPLHASTFVKDKKAISICGKSGAGKSSLAAEYIRQGCPLVSDDISVIDIQGEKIFVKKGIQHLKLWADSINQLDMALSGLSRVRSSLEKYFLPYTEHKVNPETELNTIVVLDVKNSGGYEINKLKGIEKFEYIRSNIYRGIYIDPLGLTDITFQNISRMLESIDVYHVVRPIAPLRIRELANTIDNKLNL